MPRKKSDWQQRLCAMAVSLPGHGYHMQGSPCMEEAPRRRGA